MTPQQVRRGAGLLVLLVLAGCSAEKGAATRTPAATASVVSSIEEGATLTGPVTWEAKPTLHGVVAVRQVDFLVDGEVRWTQKVAPFRFSTNGLLSPWVLGPGEHELVTRLVTNPGPSVQAVSLVTVAPGLSGSAALAGTYERQVTIGDAQAVVEYRTAALGAFGSQPPTGRWTMRLTADGRLTFTDPTGFPSVETYTAAGPRLRVYGPAAWLGDPAQPAEFCKSEKPASYTWEKRGAELVVLAVDRTCADRDQVLVGTWTRTG